MMNKIVCNAVVAACVMLLGGLLCLVVNAAQQQLPAEPDIAWSDFIAAVGSRDPMNANHVLEYYTWAIRQDNAWFEQCVAISVDNRFDAWSTNGVSAQTNMTEFVAQYEAFKLEVNASIRQTDSNVSVNNGRVQVLRYDVNRLQTDVTDTRNSVQQLMTETMDSQNALMQMLEQRVNELAARDISIGTDVCRMIDQLRRRHTSAFNFVNARIDELTNSPLSSVVEAGTNATFLSVASAVDQIVSTNGMTVSTNAGQTRYTVTLDHTALPYPVVSGTGSLVKVVATPGEEDTQPTTYEVGLDPSVLEMNAELPLIAVPASTNAADAWKFSLSLDTNWLASVPTNVTSPVQVAGTAGATVTPSEITVNGSTGTLYTVSVSTGWLGGWIGTNIVDDVGVESVSVDGTNPIYVVDGGGADNPTFMVGFNTNWLAAYLSGGYLLSAVDSMDLGVLPDGTAVLNNPAGISPALVIPSVINGVAVTEIPDGFLELNQTITSVSGANIINISASAFSGCENLVSVSFPNARTVGADAFRRCFNLATVDLPEATVIGASCFFDNAVLSSVNIPAVKTLGSYAFSSCSSLKSIALPSVTSIGEGAFLNCWILDEVLWGATNAPAEQSSTFAGGWPGGSNYVTNPTATGWGTTFGGKPVVRLPYALQAPLTVQGTNVMDRFAGLAVSSVVATQVWDRAQYPLALTNAAAFATAEQGALADTALQAETDTLQTITDRGATTTNTITAGAYYVGSTNIGAYATTAYGWGNHATNGYALTSDNSVTWPAAVNVAGPTWTIDYTNLMQRVNFTGTITNMVFQTLTNAQKRLVEVWISNAKSNTYSPDGLWVREPSWTKQNVHAVISWSLGGVSASMDKEMSLDGPTQAGYINVTSDATGLLWSTNGMNGMYADNTYTLITWFNATEFASGNVLMEMRRVGAGADGYDFYTYGTSGSNLLLCWRPFGDALGVAGTFTNLLNGSWHMIACVFNDASNYRLYNDGKLAHTLVASLNIASLPPRQVYITRRPEPDGKTATAKQGPSFFYSRAMSASELAAIHSQGPTYIHPADADLMAAYYLSEGSGTNTVNSVNGLSSGQILGGATWGSL